jgi:hypothetical protein
MDYKVLINSAVHGSATVYIETKGSFPTQGIITWFSVDLNCLIRFSINEVVSYEEHSYVHA